MNQTLSFKQNNVPTNLRFLFRLYPNSALDNSRRSTILYFTLLGVANALSRYRRASTSRLELFKQIKESSK